MEHLIAIFKGEYDTLRDLERKAHRLFYLGGGLAFVGLLFLIFGLGLNFIGFLLLPLGCGIFFASMLWMIKLQKEPMKHIFCPYCTSKNDVFASRKEFSCDICGRRVGFAPTGEPIPLELVDDED